MMWLFLYLISIGVVTNQDPYTFNVPPQTLILNHEKMPSLEDLKTAMNKHLNFKTSLKETTQRMHISHYMPTLKIKGGYNNLDSDALKTGAYSENYRSGFNIDASLEWQLSQIIWDTQEIQMHQQEFNMLKMQQAQWLDLSRYYFQYQHLLEQYTSLQNSSEKQSLHSQMIDIAIQINAMTGGYFKEKN